MILNIYNCREIISELKYEKDVRSNPNNHRKAQFKTGWLDAVIHKEIYSFSTLKRLTWRNLGYRMGQRFGEKATDEINQVFDTFAEQYESVINSDFSSWKTEIEQWVLKHRKIPTNLTEQLVQFFELAFNNTRYPEKSWFGVHNQAVSLVIGGIYLAAIWLGRSDDGIWLLLDRELLIEKIEYKPVKSTQKYTPLVWAHLNEIENIGVLIESLQIWESYLLASAKILNSPISRSRSPEFQQNRQKKRLSEFRNITSDYQYQLTELHIERQNIEASNYFDVENIEDARKIVTVSIVQRQGQSKFRQELLAAYNSRCAITGCDIEPALEAAHIIPYKGTETNCPQNGLLLRADIHTLFDL